MKQWYLGAEFCSVEENDLGRYLFLQVSPSKKKNLTQPNKTVFLPKVNEKM